MVKDLGCDYAINYREYDVDAFVEKFTDGRGFDVVFDTVGGDNLQNAFKAAALNGSVVCVSTRTTQDLSLMHSKGLTLHVVFMLIPLLHHQGREHHGDILSQVSKLVEQSKLNPMLDASMFQISEVAKAHARLEAGEHTGKIVLEA